MKSLVDIEFNSKGGVKNSNETIDYSQSAEPTLNSSKKDTLKGHLSYLAKAVKWLRDNKVKTNLTANANEITNVNNWFDANISKYTIPAKFMITILDGSISIVDILSNSNGGNFSITSYGVNFREIKDGIKPFITYLTKGGYVVFVENDIDELIANGETVAFVLKVDGMNVIIECYRLVN